MNITIKYPLQKLHILFAYYQLGNPNTPPEYISKTDIKEYLRTQIENFGFNSDTLIGENNLIEINNYYNKYQTVLDYYYQRFNNKRQQ
jgi:hypothetical protein